MTRVGFIGLGDQGAPIARRIVDGGFETTLWARRAESLEPFVDTGATIASSPAELAAGSDIVGICVVDDAGVDDVVLRADGVLAGMRAGGVVMIHSTVHPSTPQRIAQAAAERGIDVLDVPVSGGGVVASEGKLIVMAGGDVAVLDRCRPVIDTFSNSIVHLGDIGSGQMAKLINNVLMASHLALAEHAFRLGDALGLDRGGLGTVLTNGSGRSYALSLVAMAGGHARVLGGQAGPMLRKDVGILEEVATEAGAPTGTLIDEADFALGVLRFPRNAG